MKTIDRIVAALLILSAVVTVLYWLDYFSGGDVRVASARWYTAFEDAFPVADGWMALCMLFAGIGLWLERPFGARFGLLAGSALIYLAAMDITFDIENGLYAEAARSSAVQFEILINVWSLLLGVTAIALAWRRGAASSG